MVKKFVIWDSEIRMEDWKDFLEEDRELNPEFYAGRDPDIAAFESVNEQNSCYLEDERMNLDIELAHPILILAELGLWNGRRQGYKLIPSGNIKDILYGNVSGQSDCRWYCDGYNICCDETHHDGVNHYVYREIRNEENIDRFLDLVYSGRKIPAHTLNYYTRSIARDVARVYGI